jgi:hypothetical protein
MRMGYGLWVPNIRGIEIGCKEGYRLQEDILLYNPAGLYEHIENLYDLVLLENL